MCVSVRFKVQVLNILYLNFEDYLKEITIENWNSYSQTQPYKFILFFWRLIDTVFDITQSPKLRTSKTE